MESEVILRIRPTGSEILMKAAGPGNLSLMRMMKLFARPINTGNPLNVATQTYGRQILRHGERSNIAYW